MYCSEGRLITSATDLVGFLLCNHLTALDLQVAGGAPIAPLTADDPQLAVVAARGLEHEAAHLQQLRGAGRTIVEIGTAETSLASLRAREAETLSALVAGTDVVFQATFLDERLPSHAWRGHSDFVTKVPGVSHFGNYAYEPEDTKLARHVSPSAVLQLCQYAEQLERLQGSAPENIHVVLGDGERVSIRLADVASYYRAARSRFLDRALGTGPPTEALPTAHCALCRWSLTCEDKWRADDALWLVAGLSREQARKCGEAGITSVAALASPDDGRVVRGIRAPTLTRLRRQARLQVAARAEPPGTAPPYELLSADEPGTGLSALPKPSPGDLFFDLEGDPFVGDGGIEYLLGIGWVVAGTFEFKAFWAHTPAEEKRAFQDLIDFVQERRSQDPDLHIYHYAPYERTALGRLMGRYATREEEVDELLRGDVLVDLYRVVKQAVVLGSESYSLKKVERLYMPAREGEITNAASSIVEYERWLNNGGDAILGEIERYNRVDCESTWMLREWLESRRPEAEAAFGIALSRPMPAEGQVAATVSEELDEVRALAMSLWPHDEPPGDDASDEARAPWLLAQLLDWHRREAKPQWWEYFHRVNVCTEEDLLADTEAIAGLSYDGIVGTEKRSSIHRYRFDPDQEHKLSPGKPVVDSAVERVRLSGGDATPSPGALVALDRVNGTLDLKRGNSSAAVHPQALIPDGPVNTGVLREALRRLAVEAVKYGDGPGPNRVARDLVARRPPRLQDGVPGGLLQQEGENALAAAVRCSLDLDDSYLPIQGPPGSGKTWTAARVIVELVRRGRRVGITANSHAVISHLLEQVMAYGRDARVPLRAVQKADLGQRCADDSVRCESTPKKIEDALAAGEVDIVAGTAWLFAREGMAQSLDHLIIDEAGQLSLANVLAAGSAARNLSSLVTHAS